MPSGKDRCGDIQHFTDRAYEVLWKSPEMEKGRTMIGRIMAFQRCPRPNLQSLNMNMGLEWWMRLSSGPRGGELSWIIWVDRMDSVESS